MIIPPPEAKSNIFFYLIEIITKTALFVAKNGKEFEEKLSSKWKGNPKFSFLLHTDPFNTFYERCIEDLDFLDGTNLS